MPDRLRLPAGPLDLASIAGDATPGFSGDRADAEKALADLREEIAEAQMRLFAAGRADSENAPRVLFVLQGMDTAGKGGAVRELCRLVDAQGIRITGFKAPTAEERAHDFLWRIRHAVPPPGYVGIFDRSHYEDVLIARVRQLAPAEEIERRYGAINDFEADLAARGTVIVKCMLHISADEQKQRLLARLDDPTRYWKYNPGDLDERALWTQYREAYEIALERTNTDVAPWHLIPAERKWFRNLAVARLLLHALKQLDLGWPPADFDVAAQRERLLGETPIS